MILSTVYQTQGYERPRSSLLTIHYIWPGINSNVCRWTHSCVQCQRAMIQHHIQSPLSSFPSPKARFQIVHVDLVGPLPSSRGFSYLLTCIDCFTRWPEAIPITNTTTETVVQAFINGWVSWFGVPSTIVTDRGHQFESHVLKNLMSFLGCKWPCTTAYHPQTNGMVECFHRQLKCALKAQTNANSWMDVLPLVLLGIRTSLREGISSIAAELVYGTTLCLPGEYFTPTTTESLPDPSNYVRQLKALMQYIHSSPPRQPTNNYSNIPKGLALPPTSLSAKT